jgi:hypothetical protein
VPKSKEKPGMTQPDLPVETLDDLQRETFAYFVHEANPENGLIADTAPDTAPVELHDLPTWSA